MIAALVEQHLPLSGAVGVYEISSLVCQHIGPPPPSPERYQCQLDYRVGATGPFTPVKIGPPSPAAQPLFEALAAAGGDPFLNKYSLDLRLANAKVARTVISFEDRSKVRQPVEPNVQVTGALATGVLDALIAASRQSGDASAEALDVSRLVSAVVADFAPAFAATSRELRVVVQGMPRAYATEARLREAAGR